MYLLTIRAEICRHFVVKFDSLNYTLIKLLVQNFVDAFLIHEIDIMLNVYK